MTRMDNDPIRRLLREADAAAGPPPKPPGDLAHRVRQRAARRQRMRFGLSAAAAVVLAAGITALWTQAPSPSWPGQAPQIVTQEPQRLDVEATRREIERLRREADTRLAVAQRTHDLLRQYERARAARQQAPVANPIVDARREVEKAACILVYQANRMCREMDLCDSAVVKYQRVVELFPETAAAAMARERLDEIKHEKGDVS